MKKIIRLVSVSIVSLLGGILLLAPTVSAATPNWFETRFSTSSHVVSTVVYNNGSNQYMASNVSVTSSGVSSSFPSMNNIVSGHFGNLYFSTPLTFDGSIPYQLKLGVPNTADFILPDIVQITLNGVLFNGSLDVNNYIFQVTFPAGIVVDAFSVSYFYSPPRSVSYTFVPNFSNLFVALSADMTPDTGAIDSANSDLAYAEEQIKAFIDDNAITGLFASNPISNYSGSLLFIVQMFNLLWAKFTFIGDIFTWALIVGLLGLLLGLSSRIAAKFGKGGGGNSGDG